MTRGAGNERTRIIDRMSGEGEEERKQRTSGGSASEDSRHQPLVSRWLLVVQRTMNEEMIASYCE